MKKTIITIATAALVAGTAIFAVKRRKAELAKAKPPGDASIPVSVVPIRNGVFEKTREYVGVIAPLTSSDISSRITSEVVATPRSEGDLVRKGDVLIRLDDRHLKQAITVAKAKIESMKTKIASNNANLESAKASVAYWEKQFKRDSTLFERKIVSGRQLDATKESLNEAQGRLDVLEQNDKTLKAELAALEGALKIAETDLSYAILKAPYDCVVCDKLVDTGDLASPGKTLICVEQTGALKAVFLIPQSDMRSVSLGQTVTVRFKNRETTARITRIYPSVGSEKMLKTEAKLSPDAGKEFVSGQYVRIILSVGKIPDALIVPSNAVNLDNNQSDSKSIFVLRSGRLRRTPVEILADNQVSAAVRGDLKPGDEVVVSAFLGWAKLADGVKAEAVR